MTTERRDGYGRIGLALAGGGPAGAVYEIGALRALEEAVEGLDFTALHVYVGVSAGSLVAAFLANGVTPGQLVRVLDGREPADPLLPNVFFTPAYGEWLRRVAAVPGLAVKALRALLEDPNPFRAMSRLSGVLPTAFFDNEPIRRALAEAFSRGGRVDDFRLLQRHLVVVATDLGTGQAIRFGEPGVDDVPISRAIQASTALPGAYPPVRIGGRSCADGVLLKTVHASVAFDAGADLVLCVNPIVPVDTTAGVAAGVLPPGSLLAGGLPALMSQTFRTLIHSRLQAGFSSYAERYPDADFVLFEPARDEYRMFFSNVFSLSSRRAVCDLAYRATRRSLRERADLLAPMFARVGLHLRTDVLEDEERSVWEEGPARFTAEFRVMAATKATPGASRVAARSGAEPSVMERLSAALDRLSADT